MAMRKFFTELGLVVMGCLLLQTQATAQTQLQYSQYGSTKQGGRRGVPIHSVEVFANSTMLITPSGSNATIYWLDGISRMRDELNANMPKTEKESFAYMSAKRAEIETKYRSQIASAGRGITQGMKYGIEKIPAIVINRESIVYGLTNIDDAVAQYQRARQVQLNKPAVPREGAAAK